MLIIDQQKTEERNYASLSHRTDKLPGRLSLCPESFCTQNDSLFIHRNVLQVLLRVLYSYRRSIFVRQSALTLKKCFTEVKTYMAQSYCTDASHILYDFEIDSPFFLQACNCCDAFQQKSAQRKEDEKWCRTVQCSVSQVYEW